MNSPSAEEAKKLQKQADEVIRPLIPPDAQERVSRAFKQWNQSIREHIRIETGLKDDFAKSENRVFEGPAQFYTEVITLQLSAGREQACGRPALGRRGHAAYNSCRPRVILRRGAVRYPR